MFVKEVEIVMFSSGHLPDATQDRSQSPQFPSNTSLVASSTLVAHQGCPFCESFLVQVLYITPEYTNGNTHSRNVQDIGISIVEILWLMKKIIENIDEMSQKSLPKGVSLMTGVLNAGISASSVMVWHIGISGMIQLPG